SAEGFEKAKEWIERLTKDVEPGTVYKGKVTRLMAFGAFVEILPGKEGLVHISELANYRVNQVEDVVNVGDEIEVLVTEIDRQGRINLSRRALLEPAVEPEGGETGPDGERERRPIPRREGGGGFGPRREGGGFPRREGGGGFGPRREGGGFPRREGGGGFGPRREGPGGCGPLGRTGRAVLNGLAQERELDLAGGVAPHAAEEYLALPEGGGLIPVARDTETLLRRVRPRVLVDFTRAEAAMANARLAFRHGASPVIGTSGLPPQDVDELGRLADD